MLARYESTKPPEQQVAAAIKQRSRTKFRWGSTSKSSSTSSSSSNPLVARRDRSSSQPPPVPPSSPLSASCRRTSSTSRSSCRSSSGGYRSRRSSLTPRRPLQPLEPIVESELEDAATSGEDVASSRSPASSRTSTTSSPDASFASVTPASSASSAPSSAAASAASSSSPRRAFIPRVEYNMRKLLREVMGLDSVWASDHQVARHYAHIKWDVVKIQADGNCLFRAISDQLYGNEAFHGDIRRRIVEFIEREGTVFQPFIATEASAESLAQYCARMKREGEWGGNPELYAAAKLFNLHIIVHQGPMRRVRIENGHECDPKTGKAPLPYKVLHLLFKDEHYNSLRPPPDADDCSEGHKKTHSRSHRSGSSPASTAVTAPVADKQQQVRTPETLEPASDLERRSPERSTTARADSEPTVVTTLQQPSSSGSAHTAATTTANNVSHTEANLASVLGAAHVAAFDEDASVHVAVSKPTRMVFRRGKPERSSLSSVSTASVSSSSDDSVGLSGSSAQGSKHTGDASCAVESPSAASASGDAADEPPARIVFPTRLKFHRSASSRRQQQHVTAAC